MSYKNQYQDTYLSSIMQLKENVIYYLSKMLNEA
jgi:hypothetical protein